MPRVSDKERVAAWDKRVAASTKNVYEKWEEKFSCDMLEEYYYGQQWQGESAEWNQRKYVINIFYPSINIARPSMLFSLPKYKVTPRPTRIDDPMSDVEARAKLQEDTLNTYVQSPQLGFAMETGLAVLDGQFRFGVVQVGYTADFIDNPNAGKPVLRDDEAMLDSDGAPVLEANVRLKSEGLFYKWIPGKTWRVSEKSHNRTSSCDWVGYFEWHLIDDLKANKRYKNTTTIQATGKAKGSPDDAQASDDEKANSGMVKTWFLWDIRGKKRYVFAQGGEKFFLEESFKFLPFACLKFDERLGEWLPLPPTYNWVHPQNELNDTREMQRVHRGRAIRRYLRKKGGIDQDEFDKLVNCEDMTCIEVNGDPSTVMLPVQDAPLDRAAYANIPQTLDDFVRISGISGEEQQIADSQTATQANLIALAGKVREASRRLIVAQWLSELGRVTLLTLRENMALPFWIKTSIDPSSPLAAQEAQEVALLWKQIVTDQLGDIDNDITVDITSLSPIAQEQERDSWLAFLQLIINPQLGAVLSQSPTLLRKTAGMFNIHNERDIQEVSKAMEAAAMMFAQAQAQQMAAKSGGGGTGPGPTPSNKDIAGQLSQQLPVELLQ